MRILQLIIWMQNCCSPNLPLQHPGALKASRRDLKKWWEYFTQHCQQQNSGQCCYRRLWRQRISASSERRKILHKNLSMYTKKTRYEYTRKHRNTRATRVMGNRPQKVSRLPWSSKTIPLLGTLWVRIMS